MEKINVLENCIFLRFVLTIPSLIFSRYVHPCGIVSGAEKKEKWLRFYIRKFGELLSIRDEGLLNHRGLG